MSDIVYELLSTRTNNNSLNLTTVVTSIPTSSNACQTPILTSLTACQPPMNPSNKEEDEDVDVIDITMRDQENHHPRLTQDLAVLDSLGNLSEFFNRATVKQLRAVLDRLEVGHASSWRKQQLLSAAKKRIAEILQVKASCSASAAFVSQPGPNRKTSAASPARQSTLKLPIFDWPPPRSQATQRQGKDVDFLAARTTATDVSSALHSSGSSRKRRTPTGGLISSVPTKKISDGGNGMPPPWINPSTLVNGNQRFFGRNPGTANPVTEAPNWPTTGLSGLPDAAAFQQFLATAAAHGAPVVGATPPAPPAIERSTVQFSSPFIFLKNDF